MQPMKQWVSRLSAVAILCAASGCTGQSGERAAEGAGVGALAGAAGGLVSGLLWGGDPLQSAARGAVVGGTSGAVVGGVSGAKADKAQAEAAEQQKIAELRAQIGEDAFAGVTALAECKHGVAEANAQVAANSKNSNYALAGLWVDAISQADRGELAGARSFYPEIIKWDRSVENEEQAEAKLQGSLAELQNIRKRYKLPATCS